MSKINKRSHSRENRSSQSSPSNNHSKKRQRGLRHHHNNHDGEISRSQSNRHSLHTEKGTPAKFVSYLERPDLAPNLRVLCEIIAKTPISNVEKALEDTQIRITQQDTEEILKLSYSHPSSAVKFFKWSGSQLNDEHSPYTWNLLVDILGKNSLFDSMWDAIKSMRSRGLLSLATFASVFGSYAGANSTHEAFRAFELMEQYGIPRDVVALNSLLSAICRNGKTAKADEFLTTIKNEIKPDSDSYAILLEGWENEGDVNSARHTFGDMVNEIGWDPGNVPAYDSFLCTLLKGPNGLHEAMKLYSSLRERRLTPGFRFFSFALEEYVRKKDARGASLLWEAMTMRNAITRPNTRLYNLMISLHCGLDNPDIALRFLDEMVYDGAYPDSYSYNVLLSSFTKCRKPKDTMMIFDEMIKNECPPSCSNCAAAGRMCLDRGDPYGAIKCWKFMVQYERGLADLGNVLIKGLMDHKLIPEAVKYAKDMIDRGIKPSSATLAKLENGLVKAGKRSLYDEIKVYCGDRRTQRLVEVPGSNILCPVPLFPKISQANEETDDTCLEDPDNPQHSFIDYCYARRLVAINKRNKARFDVINAQNDVLLAQNDALNERVFKGVENEMNSHCENYEITNLLQRRNKHYLEARSLIEKQ